MRPPLAGPRLAHRPPRLLLLTLEETPPRLLGLLPAVSKEATGRRLPAVRPHHGPDRSRGPAARREARRVTGARSARAVAGAAAIRVVQTLPMGSDFSVMAVYAAWEESPNDRALRARQALACRIIASAGDARLVIFPAGYLWASSARGVDAIALPLVDAAERRGVAVVVGVDVRGSGNTKPRGKGDMRVTELDNWCVAWTPTPANGSSTCTTKWKQRSSTSWNGYSVVRPIKAQSLRVDDAMVEVLLCGEIFSYPIRHEILSRRDDLNLVIVLAHTAQGSRHGRGLGFFALNGLPALRSVHAAHPAWLWWELWLPPSVRPEVVPTYVSGGLVHAWTAQHAVPRSNV